ncbi:hypothetical protein PAECIP111891_02178 [Paenibacillus allorhizoplanae]|uniref:DUF7210 domain-containing protein n=1 Tax=Paenibacillus allorhizoplanae TaxID=2905648 RepID=A0ABN8GC67_9BACL|nr:hypothetical protein [Paenibacillus allorhizoplanae]CAH1202968.1 hypothetical protein PAECIP111891_02178 [Paenibacillus allorhizoplanae]
MTTKAQEEKTKNVKVKFIQNVKYRGNYYPAGTELEISVDDKASLIKDGVIDSGDSDDDDDK